MTKYINRALLLLIISLASGCAGQISEYEDPKVSVTSVKSLSGEGRGPRFEIGLNIKNPNRSALKLSGLSYSLHLEGHEVLSGVSNQLPVIEPYGEEDITIQASVDLLSSIRLVVDLMNKKRDKLSYALKAKLDPGGLRPNIHVTREGEIALSGNKAKEI